MIESWQDILTLALVGLSAAFIVQRGYQTLFGNSKGCGGGCSGCSAKADTPSGWVPLESLSDSVNR